jgi:hypothetical protein
MAGDPLDQGLNQAVDGGNPYQVGGYRLADERQVSGVQPVQYPRQGCRDRPGIPDGQSLPVAR